MTAAEPRPVRRGRGRPRGGGGPETRERILAAAADVFAETGYRATTMLAVAEAAGISQTGLVHHFPDKELLLAAVLDRRDRLDGEAVDSDHPAHLWLAEHHGRVAERVRRCLREAIEDGSTRPDVPIERIARLTIAVMDGLQVQWLMDPDGVDMVGDFAAYLVALRARWETSPG